MAAASLQMTQAGIIYIITRRGLQTPHKKNYQGYFSPTFSSGGLDFVKIKIPLPLLCIVFFPTLSFLNINSQQWYFSFEWEQSKERLSQHMVKSERPEHWEQLKLKYFFWVGSKDDLTNFTGREIFLPVMPQPEAFSLRTQLRKSQKTSQTGFVLSCYIRVLSLKALFAFSQNTLTPAACLLISQQSAFKPAGWRESEPHKSHGS